MEKRREIQSSTRYILSFAIGTILFILGFTIVYSIYYFEYQKVTNKQLELAYQIFEDKLVYSLSGDVCSVTAYKDVSDDLGFQGSIIADLEDNLGRYDKNVIERKNFYSLILAEHFEFVNNLKDNCNFSINTILFFYSNDKDLVEEGDELGNILAVVYSRSPDNVVIYSFDVDLDSDLVRALKTKYNITEAPVIIINEGEPLSGVKNIREIEEYLD